MPCSPNPAKRVTQSIVLSRIFRGRVKLQYFREDADGAKSICNFWRTEQLPKANRVGDDGIQYLLFKWHVFS